MVKIHPKRKAGVSLPKYEGPAIITKILGVKSYMVSYKNKEIKRHEDSLKKWMGNAKPVKKEDQSQMKDEGVRPQNVIYQIVCVIRCQCLDLTLFKGNDI